MATTKTENLQIGTLSLSLPNYLAKDGSLQTLHNLRYIDGGVENVYDFKLSCEITDFNDYKIIYNHETRYIALDSDENLCYVGVTLGRVTLITQLIDQCGSNDLSITHFGSVLYVSVGEVQRQFLFSEDEYGELKFEDISPIDNVIIEYDYAYSEPYEGISGGAAILGYNDSDDYYLEYQTAVNQFAEDDYIHGAFYLILAYKLFDGTVIKNSRAIMVASEDITDLELQYVYLRNNVEFPDENKYDYCYFKKLSACKPTITITVDQEAVDNNLISSIVVYATRPQTIYDFTDFHKIYEASPSYQMGAIQYTFASYFVESDASDYASLPFYEIDEIDIKDIDTTTVSITLNYSDHIEDIEFQTLYEPSFSVHNTTHNNMYEYNARLHTFNQSIELYRGCSFTPNVSTYKTKDTTYTRFALPDPYKLQYSIEIRIDDSVTELTTDLEDYIFGDGTTLANSTTIGVPLDNFISYPDYRAEKINIFYHNGSSRMLLKSINLTYSTGNNIAYGLNIETRLLFASSSFVELGSPYDYYATHTLAEEVDKVVTKNKIMVSAQNNPYYFDPINTYQIEGSDCEIYAIITAADQITENSYGTHPLVVFTSKGVFALEQGSDSVVYSKSILLDNKIQYDTIHAVAFSGVIFFTSKDEIMALVSRTISSISKSLEHSEDRKTSGDYVDIKDYIPNGKFYSLTWYGEVMFYNESYDFAYVYSPVTSAWYTRDIDGWYLDYTSMVCDRGIVTLAEKEDSSRALAPKMETNWFKMNSRSLKKMESIALVGSNTLNAPIDITVYGSNDLQNWYKVAYSQFGCKVGRTSASWRYFKVDIQYNSSGNGSQFFFYLSDLELKYTSKYNLVVD